MWRNNRVIFFLCTFLALELADCAKILVMIQFPMYTHHMAYRPIWEALSRRGHEVVLVTSFPKFDKSLTNLTEIDIHEQREIIRNIEPKNCRRDTWLEILREHEDTLFEITESIFMHPKVREIYAPNSNMTFDLLIMELNHSPATYALSHRFQAPLIGFTSVGPHSYHYYLHGLPVLPSHPSNWEMQHRTGLNLSFWQRLKNFVSVWSHIYYVFTRFYSVQQEIAEKYLGKDTPNIYDIEKNMRLIFHHHHSLLSPARPSVPKFIPYSSFAASKSNEILEKDLEAFVNNASSGFILMNFGSFINFTDFPTHVQEIIFNAMSILPYKVVLRSDKVPYKSENFYVSEWLPQKALLAHPNIKLFFYHGGIHSTEEAIYYGVPVIALPIFGDQISQANQVEALGIGKRLNLEELDTAAIFTMIQKIIHGKNYKKNISIARDIFRDKSHKDVERAIWWIEHVLRRKNENDIFYCTISDEAWYKRYNTDAIMILSNLSLIIIIFLFYIFYKLLISSVNILEMCFSRKKEKLN